MPAISPARAVNVATHAWTKLYTEIMAFMSAVYAWPATQSTTVHSKFSQLVSGLPSSVEAQTSATRASTSVVFAPGPRCCTLTVALHWPNMLHVDLREIFECAHLKFTVRGRSKQTNKQTNKRTSIHTRVHNAVTLVWGSLRLAPIISIRHMAVQSLW